MKPIHWLAVIPFIGMLIGSAVHNEVDPFILGMPFPLGWISVWVVLTTIIMAVVYLIDPANREEAAPAWICTAKPEFVASLWARREVDRSVPGSL